MGLSPDILHRLLVTEEEYEQPTSPEIATSPLTPYSPAVETMGQTSPDDVLEFEFESDEASPPTLWNSTVPSTATALEAIRTSQVQEVSVDVVPRSPQAGSSSPNHSPKMQHRRKFRLRLLSDSQHPHTPPGGLLSGSYDDPPKFASTVLNGGPRPMGVTDILRSEARQRRGSEGSRLVDGEEMRRTASEGRPRKKRVARMGPGHKGVRAEYVLKGERPPQDLFYWRSYIGDPLHPSPQIRLHLSPPALVRQLSPSSSDDLSETSHDFDSDLEPPSPVDDSLMVGKLNPDDTPRMPQLHTLPDARDAHPHRSPPKLDTQPSSLGLPPSPTFRRMQQAPSPIWALASRSPLAKAFGDLSLDKASQSIDIPSSNGQRSHHEHHRHVGTSGPSQSLPKTASTAHRDREFIVPLAADVAFFNLLTAALTSLSAFYTAQQADFRQSVDHLCTSISSSIQPNGSVEVLPTPLNNEGPPATILSSADSHALKPLRSGKASKKDLYAWREIFSMWIEAQIFESTAERTRGERTVDQAEERLHKFAEAVVKRGLGDRRTMKGKKVKAAWDDFLRLNMLLLDLKRFQMANIDAARKILKKHDKQTALTASNGFASFVRATLSAHVDEAGNISVWTFYNTSLPHVLLSSLTDTLLPYVTRWE